jgi:DNA gyrase/topoisomerase IV subunit A
MKKQDLIAKDNLSLINENAQLKKEIVQMKKLVSEAKKKNEYYAKIVQEEKDRATSELRRAYSIHEDAAKKMQKYDELKSFLWRVSNLS